MVVSKLLLAAMIFGLPSLWAPGPAGNRKGVEAHRKGQYDEALKQYGRAMESLPGERIIPYNAGTALLEARKYDEALQALSAGISDPRPDVKSASLYNTGNALYSTEKYPEALTAYREAVLADPSSMDAKFNYELAQYRLKKQQEEQEKEEQQQKDEKKDQDKNEKGEENKDQSEGDQEKNENGEQQQQPPPEPGEEQEQEPQPGEQGEEQQSEQEPRPASLLSKEEAERLLDALKANEMEMIKARLKSSRKKNVEKDW